VFVVNRYPKGETLKLLRTTLLGASASLLALGGFATTASAETPLDPILCTVTSPDPSACTADPGAGGEAGGGESGAPEESSPDEGGGSASPYAEDPLCGVTAGLVCAPGGGADEPPCGGEETPGDPGEDPGAGSGAPS